MLTACLLAGCAPDGRAPGAGLRGAAGPSAGESAIRFEDMQPVSGLDFRLSYAAGQEPGIRETIGHPAALLDADADGRLDVLLAGPDRVALFRNVGEWRFERVDAGLRQKGYWQGAAVGDVDRDGRPDLFLSGFGCAALYLNRSRSGGSPRFHDATQASGLANIRANRWQTSAAFADVDRDGWLDLYVSAYVELGGKSGLCLYPGGVTTACSPTDFTPQRGTLYRNLGGRFADVTAAFGLAAAHGNGLGAVFGDPNGDGWPDLYLANDQLPCDLFLNRGGRRFEEVGLATGTAFGPDGSPQAGMGADFGDYDGDGREDLVVTTYQREPTSVYHNDGELFTNAAYGSHIGSATATSVGWGVKWADFDLDGRLDLAIANGHPLHRIGEMEPGIQPPQRFQVFRGGPGPFVEMTALGAGLPRAIAGRALCAGDLDNDGKLDLLLSNLDGQPLLLRNTTPARGHWLTVRLIGREVVEGARVSVRAGGRTWTRRSTTGGSFLAAHDPRVHFGLGTVPRVDSVEIRWPGGAVRRLEALPVDREVGVEPAPAAGAAAVRRTATADTRSANRAGSPP